MNPASTNTHFLFLLLLLLATVLQNRKKSPDTHTRAHIFFNVILIIPFFLVASRTRDENAFYSHQVVASLTVFFLFLLFSFCVCAFCLLFFSLLRGSVACFLVVSTPCRVVFCISCSLRGFVGMFLLLFVLLSVCICFYLSYLVVIYTTHTHKLV